MNIGSNPSETWYLDFETNNIQLCFNIGSNPNETWYLDSSATQHTTLYGEWFYDYKTFNSPLPIYLGNFST